MAKHLAFFACSVASYLLFLATFLYAVAFVGGMAVGNPLDGQARLPVPAALLVDTALVGVFALQHSVMARPWFKVRWTQWVPGAIERSTYVLCSSLALAFVLWQWQPIGLQVWSVQDPLARSIVWALFAAGWALVLLSTFLINHFDLFGLRQAWLPLVGKPYAPVPFVTPLLYRMVRHPLYLGFLMAFWLTPHMTLAHLAFALLMTGYILAGIRFEERDLLAVHGAQYEDYRRRVPMLVPGLAQRSADRGQEA